MDDKKQLVQIKLLPQAFQEFEGLKKHTGLTATDVFRLSIALFKWAVERQKQGYEIYAVPIPGKEVKDGQERVAEKVNLLLPL